MSLDYSIHKKTYSSFFSKKYCQLEDTFFCQKKVCTCDIAASYHSALKFYLPLGYDKYNVFDFDGISSTYRMSSEIALAAKNRIIKYCWKENIDINQYIKDIKQMDSLSLISKRVDDGTNVVIHGEPVKQKIYLDNGLKNETSNTGISVKSGKTMVASIITKEFLKLRMNPLYRSKTCEWTNFSTLLSKLMNYDNKNDDYLFYDWLVVDDITTAVFEGSENRRSYMQQVFEYVFSNRDKEKLVSILIFKFDAIKHIHDIERNMGHYVAEMLKGNNTFIINLQ